MTLCIAIWLIMTKFAKLYVLYCLKLEEQREASL